MTSRTALGVQHPQLLRTLGQSCGHWNLGFFSWSWKPRDANSTAEEHFQQL